MWHSLGRGHVRDQWDQTLNSFGCSFFPTFIRMDKAITGSPPTPRPGAHQFLFVEPIRAGPSLASGTTYCIQVGPRSCRRSLILKTDRFGLNLVMLTDLSLASSVKVRQ